MSIHFASQFRDFRSGYLKSEKMPDSLGPQDSDIFFQICNIPLLSAPNWHSKFQHFAAGRCENLV
jgi:hypothetical protein